MLHVVALCLDSFGFVSDPPHRLPQPGKPPWEKQLLGYLQIDFLDNNLAAFEFLPLPSPYQFSSPTFSYARVPRNIRNYFTGLSVDSKLSNLLQLKVSLP
jgi:hypothetical protein